MLYHVCSCYTNTSMVKSTKSTFPVPANPNKPTTAEKYACADWFMSHSTKVNDCWEWNGYRLPNGYGRVKIRKMFSNTELAHRVAYKTTKGQVPEGFLVMHTCDNRCCVNPAHLTVGTHGDNINDAIIKGRLDPRRPTKLTVETVIEIKQALANGANHNVLATKYEVSRASISAINTGKTWTHVTI